MFSMNSSHPCCIHPYQPMHDLDTDPLGFCYDFLFEHIGINKHAGTTCLFFPITRFSELFHLDTFSLSFERLHKITLAARPQRVSLQ